MNTFMPFFVLAFALFVTADALECIASSVKAGNCGTDGNIPCTASAKTDNCRYGAEKCYKLSCGKREWDTGIPFSIVKAYGCDWHRDYLPPSPVQESRSCQDANDRYCYGRGTCRYCKTNKCNGASTFTGAFVMVAITTAIATVFKN